MSAPRSPDTERLQRWLQAVITHPGGVVNGVASAGAQAAIAIGSDRVSDVVTASARLTAAERVAIYSRSYHARLLECFRAMYPALQHALGEALFVKFVGEYLQACPPSSYTLADVSASFAGYLADTRPDRGLPADERESWPDFIIELAVLERACHEVYDGPGTEDAPPIQRAPVQAASDDKLLALRPLLSPAVRLFVFRYPVHDYRNRVLEGDAPALPDLSPTGIAIVRRHFRMRLRVMTEEQVACAARFDGRHRVDEAFAARTGDTAVIRASLLEWLDWGLFASADIGT